MFSHIKDFFEGDESIDDSLKVDNTGNPTDRDLHIATAVLLVEMASADKAIERSEAQALCTTIAHEFELDDGEIPELVQIAIAARKEQGRIDQFVNVINERFNDAQRQKVLTMIWKVVMADRKIDKFEERFAEQMRNRFKLSPEAAAEARQAAGA